MPEDFQQTVDLRGKLDRPKPISPADRKTVPKNKTAPLDKIYEEENKNKANLKTINQPKAKESREGLIRFIIFTLVILVLGSIIYFSFFKTKDNSEQLAKTENWYAVKLVNGETFYGQIIDTKADPVVMTNVYYNYDQAKQADSAKDKTKITSETGNLRLVKRGQETHGPAGTMDIVRAQVLFMEPMKSDSKVLQAILQYEK